MDMGDDFETGVKRNKHQSSVVKLLAAPNTASASEIFSLDEFGRVIQWSVSELTHEEAERNLIDFGRYSKVGVISPQFFDLSIVLPQHPETLSYDFDIDSDNM